MFSYVTGNAAKEAENDFSRVVLHIFPDRAIHDRRRICNAVANTGRSRHETRMAYRTGIHRHRCHIANDPGPIGINSATFVGYTVVHDMGYSQFVSILGSAATTFALVLPSFIIFFIIIKMVSRFGNSPIYKGVMGILKSAVAGLIGAAAVVLITPENFIDAWSWILFAAAFALSWWGKTNPILIIIGAGVAGFFIYLP